MDDFEGPDKTARPPKYPFQHKNSFLDNFGTWHYACRERSSYFVTFREPSDEQTVAKHLASKLNENCRHVCAGTLPMPYTRPYQISTLVSISSNSVLLNWSGPRHFEATNSKSMQELGCSKMRVPNSTQNLKCGTTTKGIKENRYHLPTKSYKHRTDLREAKQEYAHAPSRPRMMLWTRHPLARSSPSLSGSSETSAFWAMESKSGMAMGHILSQGG